MWKPGDGKTLSQQQLEDEKLLPIMPHLLKGTLPADKAEVTELTLQPTLYTVVDDILCRIGNSPKTYQKL